MSEEGFHEIQLNGKQLVFLFITVTVVSVVIFLCGVLVGRGVRAQRADAAVDSSVAPVPAAPPGTLEDRAAPAQGAASQAAATTDPATAAPPPAEDELSYYKRLEGEGEPKEKLKPPSDPKPVSPAAAPASRAATTGSEAAPKSATKSQPATGEPPGDGFAVQVTALRDHSEANAIVKRLAGKGYPAYVLPPPAGGAAAVYRVRVGKYKNRREAEDVAARLEKEEQFRTWISR